MSAFFIFTIFLVRWPTQSRLRPVLPFPTSPWPLRQVRHHRRRPSTGRGEVEDRGHGDIFHLLHNNLTCVQTARVYRLHVPAAFVASNDKPLPMVVDFHGWGGDSNSQADL